MPHMPVLHLEGAAPADADDKQVGRQMQEAVDGFVGFWEDYDHHGLQGGCSPMAEAPTFALCTPRLSSGSTSKPLKMFNLATPRKPEVESETSNSTLFSPPWPYSSHWPFNRAPTTLELLNLPSSMTEDDLVQILDSLGLSGMYNFVYVPWDTNRQQNQGRAIINSDRHADACRLAGKLRNFSGWTGFKQCSACIVSWCFTCQGLENLVLHCNSAWHLGPQGNYRGPWVRMGDYWVALPHLAVWSTTSATYQTEDGVQGSSVW